MIRLIPTAIHDVMSDVMGLLLIVDPCFFEQGPPGTGNLSSLRICSITGRKGSSFDACDFEVDPGGS